MADSSPLADLLDRAGEVFTLAGNLGRALQKERTAPKGVIASDSWHRLSPLFEQFCVAVLGLRDRMQSPLEGFEAVAEQLMEAARIAKGIRDLLVSERGCGPTKYLDYFPDFNSVFQNGFGAVKEAAKVEQPEDPLHLVARP